MAIAYKMFHVSRKYRGQLFPLYVNTDKPTPIGIWLPAESGKRVDGNKVKSKLGLLAYRPAWHLSEVPIATHIGVRGKDGRIAYMKPDCIWCICDYSDGIDYQPAANQRGIYRGRFDARKAYLDYVPVGGCYRYKTNPQMYGCWILAGEIKVLRVMTDMEVNQILIFNGIKPMPRYGGAINLADFGF